MTDPTPLTPGNCAVITGGAWGIGLAAAELLAAMGLDVVIADLPGATLDAAAREVAALSPNGAKGVRAAPTDVGQLADVEALEQAATSSLRPGRRADQQRRHRAGQLGPRRRLDAWRRVVDVNLWGVIHGGRAFAPG